MDGENELALEPVALDRALFFAPSDTSETALGVDRVVVSSNSSVEYKCEGFLFVVIATDVGEVSGIAPDGEKATQSGVDALMILDVPI